MSLSWCCITAFHRYTVTEQFLKLTNCKRCRTEKLVVNVGGKCLFIYLLMVSVKNANCSPTVASSHKLLVVPRANMALFVIVWPYWGDIVLQLRCWQLLWHHRWACGSHECPVSPQKTLQIPWEEPVHKPRQERKRLWVCFGKILKHKCEFHVWCLNFMIPFLGTSRNIPLSWLDFQMSLCPNLNCTRQIHMRGQGTCLRSERKNMSYFQQHETWMGFNVSLWYEC